VERPWFGERRLGFGSLRPVTWQGWLVAAGLVAVLVADGKLIGVKSALGVGIIIAACAVYFLIVWLTTGRLWSWGPWKS